MNEMKVFAFDTSAIRTVTIDNEPWFVGKDVASALGYKNTKDAIKQHIDDEDKKDGVAIRDRIGREQTPILINESGMYALIFGSKLEQAKQFKHWVTSEVLPSIRKTGAYAYDRMEVAKMIVSCKSAAGVKAIMTLFDECKSIVVTDDSLGDFIRKHQILGRPSQDVYQDYLKYSGDIVSMQNFSKKMVQHGYSVERHRYNGKLTRFYVKG